MSLYISRVSITILSLLLCFIPVAIAGFTPTNRKPASDYSRSAGKRGCPTESTQDIPLTLLAPQTTVGYTTSLRPTFAGFISSRQQVEFRIFEFSSDNQVTQISDVTLKDIQPGVFQISLPEKYPDLIVGKKYLWQLAMNCSGVKKVEAAEFILVEISPKIQKKLSTTKDGLKKANIYAEEGLWYEALTEALKLAKSGKLGNLGSNLIQDLAKYESPMPKDKEELIENRIKYLLTVAMQAQ